MAFYAARAIQHGTKNKTPSCTQKKKIIKVKRGGGETLTIEVDEEATIEDIKAKIAQVKKKIK